MSHSERAHALLSASGAKRWLNCTPSALLEERYPQAQSKFAEEGTRAHEIAEVSIKAFLDGKKEPKWKDDDKRIREELENYIEAIEELVNKLRKERSAISVLLEARLDFSGYVPGGFGTGDVLIVADKTLHVIDLKFGKGVKVDATDNPQLRLYGLGAFTMLDDLFDIDRVVTMIMQPRLDHVSEEDMSIVELLNWGESIKPIAKKAFDGGGEQTPGDHCQFCRAAGECRALADLSLSLLEIEDPDVLSLQEIGEVLNKVDVVATWVKTFKEHALRLVMCGDKIPGYKLVEGKSNRKYGDEGLVISALKNAGYEDALIFEKKLYGITAMEKVLGKKAFGEVLKDLVVKPAGAPTLAAETDKRPEYIIHETLLNDMEIPEEGE